MRVPPVVELSKLVTLVLMESIVSYRVFIEAYAIYERVPETVGFPRTEPNDEVALYEPPVEGVGSVYVRENEAFDAPRPRV